MAPLSEFKIKFSGLKQGTHHFEFDVDNLFFERFDCLEYLDSSFKVKLEFVKQSTMLLLNFEFSGFITVPCDRCLEEVNVTTEGKDGLIIKFGDEHYDDTDDIVVIPHHEHEINIEKYIYEFISIHIPQKRVHDENGCKEETIMKLEEVEIKQKENIDPRWQGLKKLK